MKSTGMINSRLNVNLSKRYRSSLYFCLSLLLFAVLTAIFVSPLMAANEGPNIPISVVNGSTVPDTAILLDDDQQNPSIIALPDKNKWFVVWEDWRNWDASGADIYGRFINSDGTYCGDEIIICDKIGNQTVPTVAYGKSLNVTNLFDNIIIAWQDTEGSGTTGYIYYDLLNTGSLPSVCPVATDLLGETAVLYNAIGADSLKSRKLPKVVYDNSRMQYWLVWIESRDALQRIEEHPFGVAAYFNGTQIVAGTTMWNFGDSNYVSYVDIAPATGAAGTPDIIRNRGSIPVDNDSDGNYDDTRESIRTVRLISHSTTATEDVYVYEYFKNINNVTIACDDSSPETMIVWEGVRGRATLTCTYEDTNENEVPDYYEPFFAELVLDEWDNDDGLVHIFSIFDKYIEQPVVHSQLIDASTKSSFYPAVGFDSSHRKFLVAWEDRDARGGAGDGVHSKIFGQLVYSGGGLYGENLAISFQDTNADGIQDDNILNSNQTRPQVSLDSTNQRFFVTWQDGRNSQVSLENLDVFGQFIDSEGSLRGNNYAVCVEPANQYSPVTAFNSSNHQFLTVWKDARNLNTTNSDIYGQRFSLGQPQLVLLNEDDSLLVPPLLDYGSVQEGESPTMSVKMKNTGDSTVQIDYVTSLGAPFAYVALPPELGAADGSTINLVPGASYKLYVRFAPTSDGTFIDDFTIESDATSLTVNLQGVRVPSVPPVAGIRVSPGSGDFGSVFIGESKSMIFTLSNTGNVDVNIEGSDIPSTGFAVSGLPGTIKAGEDAAVLVTFTPEELRSYAGMFRIFYNYGVEASEIYLTGQGSDVPQAVGLTVTPGSGDFGSINLGESKSMTFTFSNTGNVDVEIKGTDIPASGFTATGLSGTIKAGEDLVALVTFAPDQPRSYSNILRVFYDNGIGASEIVLSGVGVGNIIAAVTPPENVNFGNTAVGDSRSANLNFTNTGNVDIEITAVDLPGVGFTVAGIPGTIPAYGTLNALATFSPTLPQAYSSTLRVLYDNSLNTSEIVLSGVGVFNVNDVIEVAENIAFGYADLGVGLSANLRFINKGSVDVKITAVDLPDGAFSVTGIPGTIPAYGVLDALVTFTPLLERNYNATMRVLYDNGVATSEIDLSGAGVDISAPAVTVEPQAFSFGRVALGMTKTETLVITNTGNDDFEIVGIDLPGGNFEVEGLDTGSLAEGMTKVALVTFAPEMVGDFGAVVRVLFDHDLPPVEIPLSGNGIEIDVTPETLDFPNSSIDSSTVLDVTIINSSVNDLQVKGAVTGSDSYSVNGIAAGDIIRAGGGILVCQVTFKPTTSGYLEDGLYFNIGPVQDLAAIPYEDIDWGTQYMVTLRGTANADFVVSDIDSYTADLGYKLSISASTNLSGQLFVLLSHDPLSSGEIYALTNNGTLQPFPYESTFGWQNFWYLNKTHPGLELDLSQVDLRPLGCSLCQGEKVDDGESDINFGGIVITPPDDEVFNNASDFKYLGGTLYLATYIKNSFGGRAFDFNDGLLEMQSLNIHSLAGTWQVTSSYYGVDTVHPTFLVVTEPGNGQISATWPGYYPTMFYSEDGSGYIMTFSMGIYNYTYTITSLTESTFSGSYSCVANGETIVENAPVSGVRLK